MIYFKIKNNFSTEPSPRRLGVLFFLDKKQNQKNQDWLMQPCNATERSSEDVVALANKRRNAKAMGSLPATYVFLPLSTIVATLRGQSVPHNPVMALLLFQLTLYHSRWFSN